jgi:uncharacterized membrane protein
MNMIKLQVAMLALFIPAASTAFTPINTATPAIPNGLTSLRSSYTALRSSPASVPNALFASMHQIDDPDNLEPSMKTTKTNPYMPKNHGLHPSIHNAFQSIRSAFSKRQHKAMTFLAATIIMAFVLFAPLQDAIAAPSGGRMGGSFGGGSSRQSSSRSYSSPSRSSNSYGRGFSHGYSSGYYSRPSITVAPSIGSYGYYGRPGVAVVRTGPSIIDVIIFGAFVAVLFGSFSGGSRDLLDKDETTSSALGPGVTVAQISIALNVPNRDSPSSFLSFLDKLSHTANTDSRVGVSDLVSQVSIGLLRHKRYIFAADTEYKHFRDGEGAQRHFSSKAIQERSKFEKETTNKYGGVDYSSRDVSGQMESSNTGYSPQATSAVVTLVIAIDGDSTKLPQINNMNDLEKALTKIATDVKVDDCLRSAEILWTPDDKNDVLSKEDVNADYPKLRDV